MKRRLSVLLLALVVGFLGLPAVPASAEDTPTLTLTANRSIYVYGQTASFKAVVHAANLTYILAVRYPGSTEWHQIGYSGNVNDDTFTDQLGAYYNMVVRGQLIDPNDNNAVKVTKTISVPVKATLGSTPMGYYQKSGNYAVMSKYSAKFLSQSQPAFPGKRCLRHQVQQKKASGWKTVKTSACVKEGKQGRVEFRWGGSHPSKVNFRVRATFAGDAVNRPNSGAWVYFRFR